MARKLNTTEIEFIKYSIKKGNMLNRNWVLGIFSFIAEDNYEDDYFIIEDGKNFYYKTDEDKILLTNNYKDPLFDPKDTLNLNKGDMVNLTKNIETTVGRVVANYILLVFPFHDKIEFINEEFTIGTIEKKYIVKMLTDDPNDLKGIQVKEYLNFSDATTYISSLSNILSVAGTEKSVTPAEGIDEYKKKVINELKQKYGENALEDPKHLAELESKLKEYDSKWLEGDESEGRLMSGKTKNTARKKLFLSYGSAEGFDGKMNPVVQSLDEGWGTDPKTLAIIFNAARLGSYGRGAETQQGGVVAKMLLRATSDIDIVHKDCGSKIGLDVLITDKNIPMLLGRSIIEGNKAVLLTNETIQKYKGKTVKLRSPLFCNEAPNFCTTCFGYGFKDYKKGASMLGLELGGDVLKIALSKFHAVDLAVTEFDLDAELS